MEHTFWGYERPDGKVGSRNYVAIVPSVVCANEVAQAIGNQVMNCRPLLHHQGCCQLPPDLDRVTDTLVSLICHPNTGAALIVSLGCEGTDVDRLLEAAAQSGKPYDIVRIQEIGGMANAIADGIKKAQRLSMAISPASSWASSAEAPTPPPAWQATAPSAMWRTGLWTPAAR